MSLLGVWKLVAAYVTIEATGERKPLYGEAPRGYIIFEPSGRMMAMLMSTYREDLRPDSDAAELFQSMMSYSGTYVVFPERFVTSVDLAWDPSWEGTQQERFYLISGEDLAIRTAPYPHPAFPEQKVIAHIDWRRA